MSWRLRTQLVQGAIHRSQHGETCEALFLTSGYVYNTAQSAQARFKGEEDGFLYSRYANPTVRMFEERMMLVEGAQDARATASGMAAVTASLLCFVNAGDHVVAARALFGSCRYVIEEILPRYGINITLVEGTDLAAWKNATQKNTRAFFLESPSNPTLEIIDISAVAQIAKDAGARLIVDNVFATPILQKPFSLGADIVVYSATKHIDGQGRCLGGIVLADQDYITEHLEQFLRHTGPSLSPFNAWIMLKGLETLDLRVRASCETAQTVAEFLQTQKSIRRVLFPNLPSHPQFALAQQQMQSGGTLVTFDVKGGQKTAFALANALRLIKISNNLGDSKSLITHPATTTHHRFSPEVRAEMGIHDSTLRISIGLEDSQDLCEDLQQALQKALRT